MTYTISEAATIMGLNAPTLRYYDKEGLLPFVNRSSAGIRIFKEQDFEWLRLIECLKLTGMSIKDIRRYILWYMEGDNTLEERRQMFYERKKAVEAQMEELQKTLAAVTYKCWYYDTAVAFGSTYAHTISPDDMPEEICRMREKSGLYKHCNNTDS